jgi:hypothetical protein
MQTRSLPSKPDELDSFGSLSFLRDEHIAGRCVTVQRMGACIVVTIVHSCITLDDIADLAYVEGLASYAELRDELNST